MTKIDRRAFRFFLEHAGYATPPGQAVCAAHLAQAEAYARAAEWSYEWEWDIDGDLGDHAYWCNDERAGRKHDHEVQACILRDASRNILASLGGIIDPDTTYRRVVEAELALEAMPSPADATAGYTEA